MSTPLVETRTFIAIGWLVALAILYARIKGDIA